MEVFHKEWQDARYPQLIRQLPNYREEALNGRNPIVFYYLATSYCRTNGFKEDARKHYEWLTNQFRLNQQFKKEVLTQLQDCITRKPPAYVDVATTTDLRKKMQDPTIYVGSSKISTDGNAVRTSIRHAHMISSEEYQSRLFLSEEAKKARRNIKKMIGKALKKAGYKWDIKVTEHFLIVGIGATSTPENMEDAARSLNQSLDFYQRNYSMRTPPFLMTAYLPETENQMEVIAKAVHGLEIRNSATWGYTIDADQSVVALTPQGIYKGTLNHELFHLLSHQFFGDIPAWFDEGIASLYEESKYLVNDKRLVGVPNKRGATLKDYWTEIEDSAKTKIEVLVETKWDELDVVTLDDRPLMGSISIRQKEAVILAMARYFAFYLQEKGKLEALYRALQELTPDKLEIGPQEDTKRIIQEVLGMSFQEAEADFTRWFTDLKH